MSCTRDRRSAPGTRLRMTPWRRRRWCWKSRPVFLTGLTFYIIHSDDLWRHILEFV